MAMRSSSTPDPRAQMRVLDAVARSQAVICLLAVTFATFRMFHGADTPFLAFCVIGAAVVHLAKKPRIPEIAATLALAGALAVAYFRSGGHFGVFVGAGPIAAAAFAGLGSMLILGWKACRATEDLAVLLTAMFCPVLMIFTNVALAVAIRLSPRIFDLHLYSFDGLLGLQMSFLVGQWFVRLPLLYTVSFLVYASLPLAQVIAFVLYLRGHRMPANPMVVFTVAGVAGFLLYQLCPATGPVHVFGVAFPQAPPHSVPLQAMPLADIPRNAIPSLHSAWAFLICWSVRYCPRWMRWAAAWFVIFTLLATLGLGEHYLIDLVVAMPFAVGVQMGCAKQWFRALGALALTIAWVLYLRYGLAAFMPSPAQAWAAVLGTLAASAILAGLRLPRRSTSAALTAPALYPAE
jgi:hypothetical protein